MAFASSSAFGLARSPGSGIGFDSNPVPDFRVGHALAFAPGVPELGSGFGICFGLWHSLWLHLSSGYVFSFDVGFGFLAMGGF